MPQGTCVDISPVQVGMLVAPGFLCYDKSADYCQAVTGPYDGSGNSV